MTQGYAIPINTALSIARQIEAGHASSTVHIGATAFIGLQIASQQSSYYQGVVLGGAQAGTPAAAAGLAQGDVVTALDGKSVSSGTQIQRDTRRQAPRRQGEHRLDRHLGPVAHREHHADQRPGGLTTPSPVRQRLCRRPHDEPAHGRRARVSVLDRGRCPRAALCVPGSPAEPLPGPDEVPGNGDGLVGGRSQ